MSSSSLGEATALAEAGRLQEADALCDLAVDRAQAEGQGDALLDWLPLTLRVCDALGRPARAVQVLGLGSAVLRRRGDVTRATSMEVEAALRASAARVEGWEERLEASAVRLADEGALDWSLEAVEGVLVALEHGGRSALAADVAWRLAVQWAEVRRDLSPGVLAARAAGGLERAGRIEEALVAWERAVETAENTGSEVRQAWSRERERCRGELIARR